MQDNIYLLRTVFIGNNFPEFSTDLVAALAGLDVDDFTHFIKFKGF